MRVTLSADHKVYAVWNKPGKVTLTYATNNAAYGRVSQGSESLSPDADAAIGAEATPNEGYRFVEWRYASGGQVSSKATFAPQKTSEGYTTGAYVAIFEAISTVVKLDPNGGSGGAASVNATYNQPMPKVDAPSLEDHMFVGYYNERDGGTQYYDASMNSVLNWDNIQPESTLYAHWTDVAKAMISYGSNNEQYGTVSLKQESFNPLMDIAKGSTANAEPGYRFVEWQDSSGIQVSEKKMLIPQQTNGNHTYTAVFQKVNSTVMGTLVTNAIPEKPVSGAKVRILKGETQYGDKTETDADGKFTVYNVPPGMYNLTVTQEKQTEIIAITIKENESTTNLGTLRLSSASSALTRKTPEKTPPILIDRLQAEAEDYLKAEGNQGFVKVEMSVAKVDDKATEPEVKKGVENIFAEAQKKSAYIGIYLDITLDKYKRTAESDPWGPSQGKLKETNGLIKIIVPIPADLQGKTSNLYRVYRDHENEPTHTIQAKPNADGEYLELNAEGQTLTLYVKKFSVYALAYLTPAAYSVEHYAMNADAATLPRRRRSPAVPASRIPN